MKADDKRRIDAFEMWGWGRMLKIPLTARRTNKLIIEVPEEPLRLSVLCEKRIMGYFGHIVRRNEENVENWFKRAKSIS